MKKLMIILAAVAMAAGAQANTLLWGVNTAGTLDTTKFASGTAYLMYSATAISAPTSTDKASYSTADLTAGTVLASGAVSGGAFSGSDFVSTLTGKGYFYMAVISDDGKNLAISTTTKTTNMSSATANSNLKWTAAQFNVYSAPIPEPTSGLLMLVGLGALALRRRKA